MYYEYDGFGQRRNEHTRIFYANGVQVVAPSSRACVWGQTTISLSEPELQLSTAGLRLTLSDYLGSPRVVIDATGLVQERNTYYPSGLQIDAMSSTAAGTSDYTAGWAGVIPSAARNLPLNSPSCLPGAKPHRWEQTLKPTPCS